MPGKLKSSFEIAMERLRRQDDERGEKQTTLGERDKSEIAEARRYYEAKLAEREILHQSERRKALAADDSEALQKVEEGYRRDRERMEQERDSKIEAIRGRARKK